jgi:hypothetical protein
MLAKNSDSDGMNLDFIAESERAKCLKVRDERKLQKLTRKGHRSLATPALLKSDEPQSRNTAYKQSVYWSKNLETVMNDHQSRLKALADNSCQKVGVYLPATSIADLAYCHDLTVLMTNFSGGATSIPVQGAYKNQFGFLEHEKIFLVWAWIDSNKMAEVLEAIFAFIDRLIIDLKQEAVLLEIDRQPYMYR